jgi:hypothetical protein
MLYFTIMFIRISRRAKTGHGGQGCNSCSIVGQAEEKEAVRLSWSTDYLRDDCEFGLGFGSPRPYQEPETLAIHPPSPFSPAPNTSSHHSNKPARTPSKYVLAQSIHTTTYLKQQIFPTIITMSKLLTLKQHLQPHPLLLKPLLHIPPKPSLHNWRK